MNDERPCEAMHWYAENHGVGCRLPWSHNDEGTDHQFDDTPAEPAPKFNVVIECAIDCETFEPGKRFVMTFDDPVKAIEESAIRRDYEHFSWVEIANVE